MSFAVRRFSPRGDGTVFVPFVVGVMIGHERIVGERLWCQRTSPVDSAEQDLRLGQVPISFAPHPASKRITIRKLYDRSWLRSAVDSKTANDVVGPLFQYRRRKDFVPKNVKPQLGLEEILSGLALGVAAIQNV